MIDDGGEHVIALVAQLGRERAVELAGVLGGAAAEKFGERESMLGGLGVFESEVGQQSDRGGLCWLVAKLAFVEELDAREQALEEGPQDHEAGVVDVELVELREGASTSELQAGFGVGQGRGERLRGDGASARARVGARWDVLGIRRLGFVGLVDLVLDGLVRWRGAGRDRGGVV